MKKQTNYSFNEMTEKTGVNSQTLRNWEKAGIIKSTVVGNKKMFNNQDILNVKKVLELRGQGKSLNAIKEFLHDNTKTLSTNKVKRANMKVDYSKKNIGELTTLAKDKGIKYFRQMNKEELIESLQHPKNATKMSEQAKNRTKEKYGNKVYGDIKTVKNVTLNKNIIENIIKLNQQGMNAQEILKTIK